jgi:hypothetical protein
VAILIKCNESDLVSGSEQNFTLRKQKGVGITRSQEAFIWVSELPREGRPHEAGGLRMRGEVTAWEPANGGRTTVTVRITERLTDGLGMDAFAHGVSEAAMDLYRAINAYRHRRIWGLSRGQRQAVYDVFCASITAQRRT